MNYHHHYKYLIPYMDAKEAYMITLNPFVENNKARINQFLNNLCEVGDFYYTLEVCYLCYA